MGSGRGKIRELDAPLLAKLLEVVTNELRVIIGHDQLLDIKMIDDVLIYETLDFMVTYSGEDFIFDPLGEVIGKD